MTRVEFFSAATSTTVCSRRSCSPLGSLDSARPASASFTEACSSPSAAMMRARRSRSASACRDMDRFIPSGSATSLSSTRSIFTPHGPSVGSSITARSSALIRSRSLSSSSRSALPLTLRSEVWATCDTANR